MRKSTVVALGVLTVSVHLFAATEAELVYLIASRSVAVVQTDNKALGSAVAYMDLGSEGTGYLTNCHVLQGAKNFVVSYKGQRRPGFFLAGSPESDICLVASALRLPIANPRSFLNLRVGETVFAIGSPRGLELSITSGIVSQLRGDALFDPPMLVQTTAPISPGSSGGGLFDVEGRLIGITSFMFRDSQSLNFAVSVNMANGLIKSGSARALEDLQRGSNK
jgi:S1-C subfamily serine protease